MKHALFIQVTEPGAYPPLINAAHLMVNAGWHVTFLTSPTIGSKLKVPISRGIDVVALPKRPTYVVGKFSYLRYCSRAIALALQLKPTVVYASDPLGALPGFLAARVCNARLLYHEHDSPSDVSDLNPLIRVARGAAFNHASLIVFPNAERAYLAQRQSEFTIDKLRIVWNVPLLADLPNLQVKSKEPFVLYYHGSINPERLPETVLEAVHAFDGAIRLDVAGYEAAGAPGYIERLLSRWNRDGCETMRYLGEHQHNELLSLATRCDAGLALMPKDSVDVNMKCMVGASNKAFDYMAAGLPLIVSTLPEWCKGFVEPGYAKACDPRSVESVKSTLSWFLQNPQVASEIAKINRIKIEIDWNYDYEFQKVLDEIE